MTAHIIRGAAGQLPLPDQSIDLIVTSPPYYALRDYTDGGASLPGQIGAEPTPAAYIDALLACTAEWVRVLKPKGSIFVNLGDKYNSAASGQNGAGGTGLDPRRGPKMYSGRRGQATPAARPKSLLLLPERYRIGAVDHLGLTARAVLVWSKPNGLPESVTDRVRRSHEDWVHLTKQPRYYSAVDAIRESYAAGTAGRYAKGYNPDREAYAAGGPTKNGVARHDGGGPSAVNPLGKLPGSVWEIPTEPLRVPEHLDVDHYAAFPTEWPRRLILGWSPAGICVGCGQGRWPVCDRTPMQWRPSPTQAGREAPGTSRQTASGTMLAAAETRIVGHACACQKPTAPTRPAVVLDPFGGTGTAALVASVLGRTGISVDLSADYSRLAAWRTTDPAERARAARMPKPEPVTAGQLGLFDGQAS